jgi:hypothetical protein
MSGLTIDQINNTLDFGQALSAIIVYFHGAGNDVRYFMPMILFICRASRSSRGLVTFQSEFN